MEEKATKLEYIKINGVQVPLIYEFSDILPIISLKIVIKASGFLEDGKKFGLSHLSSKMLDEGTKSLGALKFAQKLEDKAIRLGSVSGRETWVFSLDCLGENFPYGLKMLTNLLDDPNFTAEALEKAKNLTLGQISAKKSDFDYIAYKGLQKILYKNTPLEHQGIGTEESIKDISLDNVKSFFKNHLDLQNAMVVIGGNVSLDEAKKYAKKVLCKLKKGKKRQISFIKTSEKMELKTLKKDTEQAYVYFGSPFYMKLGDSDLFKAKVLSFILGASGFGSRLMEEIRVKRGLAYSVYARLRFELSSSDLFGYLQTKNENKDEAINIVKEVVAKFLEKGVSKSELEGAKKFLLGSEPLRNETLIQRLTKSHSEIYKGYKLGQSDRELEQIEALELEDLNAFIKSHKEILKLSFFVVCNEDK